MKLVIFTHANSHQPVVISEALAFSWWHSPAHKSTYIMGNGGALIPVLETFEEVTKRIQSAREITTIKGEKKNGKTKG